MPYVAPFIHLHDYADTKRLSGRDRIIGEARTSHLLNPWKRTKYDSNEIITNGRGASSPSRSLTVDAFSLTSSQEQSEEPSLELRQTPEPTTTTATTATKSYEIEIDNEETQRKEEEQHKKSLFLYVFILRCIAYPFNSKPGIWICCRVCICIIELFLCENLMKSQPKATYRHGTTIVQSDTSTARRHQGSFLSFPRWQL